MVYIILSFISENDWSNLFCTRQTFNYLVSYNSFQYFCNKSVHIVCKTQTDSVQCLAVFKNDLQNNFWIDPFL